MFVRELDLFPANANSIMVTAAAASAFAPKVLADLLGRVLGERELVVERGGAPVPV